MLSNQEIIVGMTEDRVIIEPFNIRNLGPNSYDVRLGEFYFREQRPLIRLTESYNIYDQDDVRRIWGYHHEAKPIGVSAPNLHKDDKVIVIKPGECILAHTQEFIGGRLNVTTMMKARSSVGRSFIRVCACAGMGDVGYFNRWTMEIENISQYYNIPLKVGMRIAQIVFDKVGDSFEYSIAGKYQTSDNLTEVMKTWKPDDMLPRLHNDWELRPE